MGFLRLSGMISKESLPFVRRFATDARKIPRMAKKKSGPVVREVVKDGKVSVNNRTGILIGKVVTYVVICAPFVYMSEFSP